MRVPVVLIGLLSTSLLSAAALAANAPVQLRNKTIIAAWAAQRTVMTPKGERQAPPFAQQRTIYVSNAGRVFVKSSVQTLAGTKEAELAPGDATAKGGAREVEFVGEKLIAIAQRGSGAGRMVITFGPGYSTCSVDLTFGRPNGAPIMFRNARGVMVELLKVSYSGQRCSVHDGNAFAN